MNLQVSASPPEYVFKHKVGKLGFTQAVNDTK